MTDQPATPPKYGLCPKCKTPRASRGLKHIWAGPDIGYTDELGVTYCPVCEPQSKESPTPMTDPAVLSTDYIAAYIDKCRASLARPGTIPDPVHQMVVHLADANAALQATVQDLQAGYRRSMSPPNRIKELEARVKELEGQLVKAMAPKVQALVDARNGAFTSAEGVPMPRIVASAIPTRFNFGAVYKAEEVDMLEWRPTVPLVEDEQGRVKLIDKYRSVEGEGRTVGITVIDEAAPLLPERSGREWSDADREAWQEAGRTGGREAQLKVIYERGMYQVDVEHGKRIVRNAMQDAVKEIQSRGFAEGDPRFNDYMETSESAGDPRTPGFRSHVPTPSTPHKLDLLLDAIKAITGQRPDALIFSERLNQHGQIEWEATWTENGVRSLSSPAIPPKAEGQ